MNTFYHGDCLFVMNHDIESNSVDFIYADPPYFTKKVQRGIAKWNPAAMEISYDDSKKFWSESIKVKAMRDKSPEWMQQIAVERPDFASYLYYWMERLQACKRVLKDTGAIALQCDEKASHYLKMIMDEVFGYKNYRNEIIWYYSGKGAKAIAHKYGKNHDTIFIYSKTNNYTFKHQYIRHLYTTEEAHKRGLRQESNGAWFKTSPRGDYTDKSIDELERQGRVHHTKNGKVRIKYPLKLIDGKVAEDELVGDVWFDIPDAMHVSKKELTGYPTQKTIALLSRLIEGSCPENGIVLDPCGGCGTAIVAAQQLGRNWIGIDINQFAHDTTINRKDVQIPLFYKALHESKYISRNLGEVTDFNPQDFERWVNEYYKATKPFPDGGVDGITSQDGIAIQSKTYEIKYPILSQLVTDAECHPKVRQPVDKIIVVSQSGFNDSARKRKYEIETKKHITVELITPADMLPTN